jgi:hypothetical protein
MTLCTAKSQKPTPDIKLPQAKHIRIENANKVLYTSPVSPARETLHLSASLEVEFQLQLK